MTSPLIAAVVQVLGGLEGLVQVRDNGLDPPSKSPAAAVELAAEKEHEPQELADGLPLDLEVTLAVAVLAKITPGKASQARDLVAGLARQARRALAADVTLGGACLDSRCEPTEFEYRKIVGEDWCLGTILLTALLED